MAESMPLSLIIAWIVFFGFLNTHQRHATRFRGESQGYLLALQVSTLLGSLVGLALLVYYFMQVAWYWPIILFVIASLIAGFGFGLLDAKIGQLGMSLMAFIGWPVAAIWVYFIIRNLKP